MTTEVIDTKSPGDRAFEIEQLVISGCRAIRVAWVGLASYLHEFHDGRMWELRDCSSFDEWLGTPEISIGRSHARALVEAYHELVVVREIDPERLAAADATKIVQVLPALRAGRVETEDALSDAESLSRADLRERYGSGKSGGSKSKLEQCATCGAMRDPSTCSSSSSSTPEPIDGQMEVSDFVG
jgi:hypothetical protein